MRNKVFYILLIVSLVIGFTSQTKAKDKGLVDPEWINEANKEIVYKTENKQFQLVSEIEYANNKQFDLYRPHTKLAPPVVILIHGGPIPDNLKTKPKDWGFFTSYGEAVAQSGFAAITFNHSLFGLNNFPDSYSDINNLISYIKSNHTKLKVDSSNIILWFFSGSGALMAPFIAEQPKNIKGIIGFYPLMDLAQYQEYLAEETAEMILKNYSPKLALSEKSNVPIFIAKAGLDSKEINDTIGSFMQKARHIKANVVLHNHAKGKHGFDNDLGEGEANTRKIIELTINFIREQTNKK